MSLAAPHQVTQLAPTSAQLAAAARDRQIQQLIAARAAAGQLVNAALRNNPARNAAVRAQQGSDLNAALAHGLRGGFTPQGAKVQQVPLQNVVAGIDSMTDAQALQRRTTQLDEISQLSTQASALGAEMRAVFPAAAVALAKNGESQARKRVETLATQAVKSQEFNALVNAMRAELPSGAPLQSAVLTADEVVLVDRTATLIQQSLPAAPAGQVTGTLPQQLLARAVATRALAMKAAEESRQGAPTKPDATKAAVETPAPRAIDTEANEALEVAAVVAVVEVVPPRLVTVKIGDLAAEAGDPGEQIYSWLNREEVKKLDAQDLRDAGRGAEIPFERPFSPALTPPASAKQSDYTTAS